MPKKKNAKDPHAAREAEKYENPIPSREFILTHLEKIGEPVSYPGLCDDLGLEDEDQCEALRRRLIAMSRDGQLVSNRRGVYGLADKMELMKGRIQGNRDGSGFFIPQDGSDDLFLSSGEMNKVFDDDIVLVRVAGLDQRGRKEGMIVEVLERRCKQVVGRYYREQGFGVLVPDNRRIAHEIMIPEADSRSAQDGQFVVAEIVNYPERRRKPVGKIVEILGDHMAPGMEIEVAVRSHAIPFEWPAQVTKELRNIPDQVEEGAEKGRIDLRRLPFATIDGEDAKDFDDAVYAEPAGRSGWNLYVAIADVSHYVRVGSALDQEATVRGNSVYFPGHVIPMLPEKLSNGLCSLKPNVDRLVMVCEMKISASGELRNYKFYESIMHSHARLTYNEVADMVQPPDTPMQEKIQAKQRARYQHVVSHVETLHGLYKVLRQARMAGGALDFDTTETRIVFGETRKIAEIVPVVRNDAHRMIEECMLCANVATARLLAKSKLPVLYRVHEGPNTEKLEDLRRFLAEMGLNLPGGDKPRPRDYQFVLQQVQGRPDAQLLQTVLIRSLMQAVYQPENKGHFGLGFDAYTHFTSPIRRYPDLLVHRAIRFLARNARFSKHVAKGKGAERVQRSSVYPYEASDMQQLGENCSHSERRADAAGYDVVDWLKCEYIEDRVGDDFDGTISGVTGFGLFVQLNDIYVEGLVHITALRNDYYHFDPMRHLLKGERSGMSYHLGDTVRVKVARVDLDERKIDLVLADGGPTQGDRRGRGAGRGPGKGSGKGLGKGKGPGKGKAGGGKGRGKKGSEKSKAKTDDKAANLGKGGRGRRTGRGKPGGAS
ncbi:MAG: ribonuclease R [Pseudohongiellaceae bacterium]